MSEGFLILLADDQAGSRDTLRNLLEQLSLEVLEAETGDDAIGVCETDDPDLILLGADLPGLGGLETTRELRALSPMFAKIPVLLIVDEIDAEGLLDARAAGVEDVLVRPFEDDGLEHRLLMHLAQSRETRTMMRVSQQRGLSTARAARNRMLDEPGPDEHAGLAIGAIAHHSEVLGGDVPGVVPLGPHHVGVFTLGTEGRDLGPTLLLAEIHALLTLDPDLGPLQRSADENGDFLQPAELLAFLDEAYPAARTGWHHHLSYALLDGRDGSFRYAFRGTPPPLHCSPGRGEVTALGTPEAAPGEPQHGDGSLAPGELLVLPGSFVASLAGPGGPSFAGAPLEAALRDGLAEDSEDPIDDATAALLFALDRHLGGRDAPVDVAITLVGRPPAS